MPQTKLEKALNEAADDGYRISRAAPERIHNAVADALLAGGHDETTGAVILMEKTPSGSANYQYAVVRLFARPSSWERDINKAASQGFRVIPGYGTLTLRQGFVLGTAQAPITIMEKAPGGSEVKEYVICPRTIYPKIRMLDPCCQDPTKLRQSYKEKRSWFFLVLTEEALAEPFL